MNDNRVDASKTVHSRIRQRRTSCESQVAVLFGVFEGGGPIFLVR
jgi:hypothetical protein